MPISPPLSLYLSYLQVRMHSFLLLYLYFILPLFSICSNVSISYFLYLSCDLFYMCVLSIYLYTIHLSAHTSLLFSLFVSLLLFSYVSSYHSLCFPIYFYHYQSIYLSTPFFLYIIHLTHPPPTTSLSLLISYHNYLSL